MESLLWIFAPVASLLSIIIAIFFYKSAMKTGDGDAEMRDAGSQIRHGAYEYLRQQYRIFALIIPVMVIFLSILSWMEYLNHFAPFAFLTGGLFSGLCGIIGLKVSTGAPGHVVAGSRVSLDRGLRTAFRSGAVMGLVVAGFGLLDISLWFAILNFFYDNNVLGISQLLAVKAGLIAEYATFDLNIINSDAYRHAKLVEITSTMITFGVGAAVQALFTRVGGGVFASSTGLSVIPAVGLPADDDNNPAGIVRKAGDHVREVAGMGAELYDTFCVSILATAMLGAVLPLAGIENLYAVIAPMVVAGVGMLVTAAGMHIVRTKEDVSLRALFIALNAGTWGSSFMIIIALGFLSYLGFINWGVFGASVAGLVAGLIIAQSTEFFTSEEYAPVQGIAKRQGMGVGAGILDGISVGMLSTIIPVVTVAICTLVAFGVSGGFGGEAGSAAKGLYGVGIASVGMLATMGMTIGISAFGPIARNALEFEAIPAPGDRTVTRAGVLSMLGAAAGATGKGFAIGSAAMSASVLMFAYLAAVKLWIVRFAMSAGSGYYQIGGVRFYNNLAQSAMDPEGVLVQEAKLADFTRAYDIGITNPKLLCGLLLGAMVVFAVAALAIKSVNNAGNDLDDVVRREISDIPRYAGSAVRWMMFLLLVLFFVPIITGLFLGVAGTVGLLAGAIVCGFSMACFFSNTGDAISRARLCIQKGDPEGTESGSRGNGDTGMRMGIVFRDTVTPALNALIKFMPLFAIVCAGFIVKVSPYIAKALGFAR